MLSMWNPDFMNVNILALKIKHRFNTIKDT